jgi:hypothetical protein
VLAKEINSARSDSLVAGQRIALGIVKNSHIPAGLAGCAGVAGGGVNRMKSKQSTATVRIEAQENTESWVTLLAAATSESTALRAKDMVSRGIGAVKCSKMQRRLGFTRPAARKTNATIGWCARTNCACWSDQDFRAGS